MHARAQGQAWRCEEIHCLNLSRELAFARALVPTGVNVRRGSEFSDARVVDLVCADNDRSRSRGTAGEVRRRPREPHPWQERHRRPHRSKRQRRRKRTSPPTKPLRATRHPSSPSIPLQSAGFRQDSGADRSQREGNTHIAFAPTTTGAEAEASATCVRAKAEHGNTHLHRSTGDGGGGGGW